ncbi:MAG: putative PurR-regulated permease PerM [Candidatus Azotimanducaceae bacterium]|jgi:predicted PurR-regulated permease PerM
MSNTQKSFILATIAGLLLLVYLLQSILMPFLVGLALAYLGDPLVDRLQTYKFGRTGAVGVVFLIFILVFGVALLILLPMLTGEVSRLIQNIPRYLGVMQEHFSPVLLENFGVDPFDVSLGEFRARLAQNWQQAGGIAGRVLARVSSSGLALIGWIANLALVPVVAFYLLRDWDLLVERIRHILPRQYEDTTVILAKECDEVLSAFLRGQLLIMFLLGCIYALGLTLVGLDLAVLIGMLAGLASLVPYLGFIVGIVAASVAALFQFQDFLPLVYVALVFGTGQLLEGTVMTPLLVGDRIGLHPVAVIFAILAGGQLFGFVGVLLALPIAAVVMVFVRHLLARYKQSEYYDRGDDSGDESSPRKPDSSL